MYSPGTIIQDSQKGLQMPQSPSMSPTSPLKRDKSRASATSEADEEKQEALFKKEQEKFFKLSRAVRTKINMREDRGLKQRRASKQMSQLSQKEDTNNIDYIDKKFNEDSFGRLYKQAPEIQQSRRLFIENEMKKAHTKRQLEMA